jgi:nucleoid-associated protein YgaU
MERTARSPQTARQVPTSNAAPATGMTAAAGAYKAAPRSDYANTVAASSASVLVEASTSTGRAAHLSPNARFHVVQPGESLWSIAKKLLGPNATAAQIAREVDRLWALNKDRMGTGNPNLLIAGAKLRLR